MSTIYTIPCPTNHGTQNFIPLYTPLTHTTTSLSSSPLLQDLLTMPCYGMKEETDNTSEKANSEAGDTDPDSTLQFILDPCTIPVVQEPRMVGRDDGGGSVEALVDSDYRETLRRGDDRIARLAGSTATLAPPGLPIRSNSRKYGSRPQPRIPPEEMPPRPWQSLKGYDDPIMRKRLNLLQAGVDRNANLANDSLLMEHLSDSQRTKTRAFTRYYRFAYTSRALSLPDLPKPTMKEHRICERYLMDAKREVFFFHEEHRANKWAADQRRKQYGKFTAWNLVRSLAGAEGRKALGGIMEEQQEWVNLGHPLKAEWSEEVLQHKEEAGTIARKQKEHKRYLVFKSEYVQRSPLSRKAWLKRMGGLENDEDAGSELGVVDVKQDDDTLQSRPDTPKQDEIVEVAEVDAAITSDDASEVGSEDYSVLSGESELQHATARIPGRAHAVTVVRAATKPSLYTLKKSDNTQKIAMPGL